MQSDFGDFYRDMDRKPASTGWLLTVGVCVVLMITCSAVSFMIGRSMSMADAARLKDELAARDAANVVAPVRVTPVTLKPREAFLNIDAAGTYQIHGKSLSVPQLEDALFQMQTDGSCSSVVIRSDKRAKLDAVVAAMNACKKAGISFVLNTAGDG